MSTAAISPWHSEEEDVDITSNAEVAFRKVMEDGIPDAPGACKNDRALYYGSAHNRALVDGCRTHGR